MTDSVGPDPEAEGWGDDAPVTYPEYGPLPEARFSLTFKPGGAPMLTVRAHTAAELNAAMQELEEANTYNVMGIAHSSLGAQVALGAGLGPATQVPAPAAPVPTPPPFGANVSVPGAPGYQGPPVPPPLPAAPAQPTQAAAPQISPEYAQAGWYKMFVPFKQKPQFDAIAEQYQMKKGRPTESGHYSFGKDKNWYVHPDYAGAFAQWKPVPA